MNNSIVSNIGSTSSPNNGRFVDDRGNSIDTLMVTNSTFYNITARALRDDGGPNNFVYFRHNTFVNHGQQVVTFGQTSEAHFVNNVVVNGGFFGRFPAEPDFILVSVDSVSEGPQTVNIAHNVFYEDPAIAPALPDSVEVVPTFNETALNFIEENGAGDTNFEEELIFTNGPEEPSTVMVAFHEQADEIPELDNGLTGDRTDPEVDLTPFDFSYSDATMAYTASTHGQPLGDLGYFELVPTAGESEPDIPRSFRLVGNYPNPFNPSTTIKFDLAASAEVSLEVFDITGRKVMSTPVETMAAGSAELRINALNAVSGTYLYRVNIESGPDVKVLTGTMTLLK
jgi:hypothetical protein